MRKIAFFSLLAVITASYSHAQFTFGARAGFNLTNWAEEGADTKRKPGFQIGVVGDYAISNSFSIQPGVLFSTQGCKWYAKAIDYESLVNLNYLQVPVNAQYKINLDDMKLLLQAGPYIGYAVSGKTIVKSGDPMQGGKIKFGNKIDEMNALDFGLGFGAGLQFGKVQAGLGYNLGLANLRNYEKRNTKNNGFAFTVTYLFGNI